MAIVHIVNRLKFNEDVFEPGDAVDLPDEVIAKLPAGTVKSPPVAKPVKAPVVKVASAPSGPEPPTGG